MISLGRSQRCSSLQEQGIRKVNGETFCTEGEVEVLGKIWGIPFKKLGSEVTKCYAYELIMPLSCRSFFFLFHVGLQPL